MEQKKPLIILAGPTAVGKTKLSVKLAKAVDGEIISADSMQVYRYMDIGSAKIRKEEMQGVPHHLIDVLLPWEEFHVVIFQRLCRQAMNEIYGRGHIPILVGGTGFYIQSVLYDIDFSETEEDDGYRGELEEYARQNGAHALHEMLRLADPGAAAAIHENNIKRVIRALEYHHKTGERISEHNERERQKQSAYASCYFVLNDERERLYQIIDRRVEQMLQEGLVEEVRELRRLGCNRDMVSMQGLGYKEILDYLCGDCTLEEAVYRIKRDTRHFAKRQLTWFKREKEVIWIDKPEFAYDEDKMLAYMLDCMKRNGEENGTGTAL